MFLYRFKPVFVFFPDIALKPYEVTLKRPRGKKTPVKFDACFAGLYCSWFREVGTGELYVCGNNKFRQLGATDPADFYPFAIPCDKLKQISANDPGMHWTKITAGRDHTLFLTDNGK
jgi:alpha-tubulin suppressor-like RCC1 family protein